MSATQVNIQLVPGNMMPRYEGEITELELHDVVITERAMQSGLPALDLQLTGPDGKRYFAVISGRIANSISAAVKGVNMRNHGVAEP